MTFPFPIFQPPQAGEAFSPLSISNLIAWYDISNADSLTLSGSDITGIADLSGNSHHCSGVTGTALTKQTAAQNGLDTAYFNAAWIGISPNITRGSTSTYFCVGRRPDTSFDFELFGSSTADDTTLEWHVNNRIYLYTYADGSYFSSEFVTDTSSYHRIVGVDGGAWDNPNSALYFNNTTLSVITHGAQAQTSTLNRLGYADSAICTGYIGECGMYSRALNSTELSQLGAYLRDKWGVI